MFCQKCGKELKDGEKICSNCGYGKKRNSKFVNVMRYIFYVIVFVSIVTVGVEVAFVQKDVRSARVLLLCHRGRPEVALYPSRQMERSELRQGAKRRLANGIRAAFRMRFEVDT